MKAKQLSFEEYKSSPSIDEVEAEAQMTYEKNMRESEEMNDPGYIQKAKENQKTFQDSAPEQVISEDRFPARRKVTYNLDGTQKSVIMAPKSSWSQALLYLERKPFRLDGRNYLQQIYDTRHPRILLKTGRQVEKSVIKTDRIFCANGKPIEASSVKIGDNLQSLDVNSGIIESGLVEWVSNIYTKPALKIRTRLGHEINIGIEHPIRKWDSWVKGEDLRTGDRVATVRRSGYFNPEYKGINDREIELLALDSGFSDGNSEKTLIPDFVFDFEKRQTALFLSRLWSVNGLVKNDSKSEYSIEYRSPSKLLIKQVQSLLWKFGIPSRIKEETKERAHVLGIETVQGIHSFLSNIGAIGENKHIPLPDINLEKHPHSDVYWDEIVSIEDIGDQECIDFRVESHHNFIQEGVVSHNSTSIAAWMLTESCIWPCYSTLYVSPTAEQSRTFSSQKLKPMIEESPLIRKYFYNNKVEDQVFNKGLLNGSKIFLRYAFLTADRARGISSHKLCMSGSSRIYTKNHGVLTVNEIIDRRLIDEEILCFNNKNEITYGKINKIFINGTDTTHRLKVESGRFVDVTKNHEILTIDGWKYLKDITTDDYIAMPTHLPMNQKSVLSKEFFYILGYLIGDGTFSTFHQVAFSTTEIKYAEDIKIHLKKEGADFSHKAYEKETFGKKITEQKVSIYGGRDGWKKKLRDLNLIGQVSSTKSLPFLQLFKNESDVTAFMSRLYSTDGYICVSGSKYAKSGVTVDIGYVTTSHRLALDVQDLLLMIGIKSIIRERLPKNGVSRKIQYIVQIRNKKNADLFFSKITVFGKEDKCTQGREVLASYKSFKVDRIPLAGRLREMFKKHKVSYDFLWKQINISWPRNGKVVSRDKIRKLNDWWKRDELEYFINSDVSWEKVSSILENKPEMVYDFEIPSHHQFFANGIPIHNCIDEIQDIISANIPVIAECLSHSDHPTQLFCGTPKTFENTIEQKWQGSSQCEWAVPCDRHTPIHYNILGMKNIGKNGPICDKCGAPINTEIGRWVIMNPNYDFMGFRISQLMVKWKHDPARWKDDIILPMDGPDPISEQNYMNEKLGLSFDSADKPISKVEILECCDHTGSYGFVKEPDSRIKGHRVYGGVDWGSGKETRTESGKKKPTSYTVLTLTMRMDDGRRWTFYMKRYQGKEKDPEFIIEDVYRLHNLFNVTAWGLDWGFGWGVNNRIISKLGTDRAMQFEYVGRSKGKMRWDMADYKFIVNRSLVMGEFFKQVKQKKWLFPRWKEFESYANDILAIFKDYAVNPATRGMLFFNHPMDKPDDACHSIIYSDLAAQVALGEVIIDEK